MINWYDITYLYQGTDRQRLAYDTLGRLRLFEVLRPYHPVLVGTIPLDVDIADSDLDIICRASDLTAFTTHVTSAYGNHPGFSTWQRGYGPDYAQVITFSAGTFRVEIFGQDRPTREQNAYRHMTIEARLLELGGQDARETIRDLKRTGMKTEPAFARYFGIGGDPYHSLLEMSAWDFALLRRWYGNR